MTERHEERWQVGVIQNGPMHDAGLRFFVVSRMFPQRPVAWTITDHDARMIAQALDKVTEGE